MRLRKSGNLEINRMIENYRVLNGLPLEQLIDYNLISNGTFDTDTTDWVANNYTVTLSVVDGKLLSTTAVPANYFGITQIIDLVQGDVYYLNFDMKPFRTHNVGTYFCGDELTSEEVTADVWNNVSLIHTTVLDTTSVFGIYDNGKDLTPVTVGTITYYDNVVLYNLTEIFGEGNEPSKYQMDKYMRELNLREMFENNLVTNGDFATDDFTDWDVFALGTASAVVADEQAGIFSPAPASDQVYIYPSDQTWIETGNTYYVKMDVEVVTGGVKIGAMTPTVYVSDVGVTNVAQLLEGAAGVFNIERAYADTEAYVDNVEVYDLTLIFGSGNEPTVEEIDAFIFRERMNDMLKNGNLIENGDFELDSDDDGLADNFLYYNSDSGVVIKNTQGVTVTSVSSYSAGIKFLHNATNEHKYYVGFKNNLSNSRNKLITYSATSSVVQYDDVEYDNEYSGIIPVIATEQYTFHLTKNSADISIGDIIVFNDIKLFDLTEYFGSGNEPTVEQMDYYIANQDQLVTLVSGINEIKLDDLFEDNNYITGLGDWAYKATNISYNDLTVSFENTEIAISGVEFSPDILNNKSWYYAMSINGVVGDSYAVSFGGADIYYYDLTKQDLFISNVSLNTAISRNGFEVWAYENSGLNNTHTFSNIILIDLEELFGLGNEPTKAQMDEWYEHYRNIFTADARIRKTVPYENIAVNGNFETVHSWDTDYADVFTVADNVAYIESDGTQKLVRLNQDICVIGHKYYTSFEVVEISPNYTYTNIRYGVEVTKQLDDQDYARVYTSASFRNSIQFVWEGNDTNNYVKIKNYKCYDLTEIFGYGNELSLEDFETFLESNNKTFYAKAFSNVELNEQNFDEFNLIENDEFEVDDTGWTGVDNVIDGIGDFTATSQYDFVKTDVALIKDDLYYVAINIKTESLTDKIYLEFSSSTSGKVYSTETIEWQKLSNIMVPVADSVIGIVLFDYRASGWDKVELDNAKLYNLTDLFGSGKEPTLEEFEVMLASETKLKEIFDDTNDLADGSMVEADDQIYNDGVSTTESHKYFTKFEMERPAHESSNIFNNVEALANKQDYYYLSGVKSISAGRVTFYQKLIEGETYRLKKPSYSQYDRLTINASENLGDETAEILFENASAFDTVFTVPTGKSYIYFWFFLSEDVLLEGELEANLLLTQLNLGSTDLDYETPILAYSQGYELEVPNVNLFDKVKVASNTLQTITGLKANTQYTMSSNVPVPTLGTDLYFNGLTTGTDGVWLGNSKTHTSDANGELTYTIYIGREYEDDLVDGTYYIQLEEGDTATTYQPHQPNVELVVPDDELEHTYVGVLQASQVDNIYLNIPKPVTISNFKVWDLTTAFGEGYEPSADMMETLYEQFLTKMRIKSDLVIIQGEFKEID